MKRLLCIMLICGISALCVGCGFSASNNDNSAKTEETSNNDSSDSDKAVKEDRSIVTLKDENSNLTYDDFKNMKLGITYDECKASYGEANMLVETSESKTYTWKMGNNKNISVVVKNDKITSKSQGLLTDKKYGITRAQYDSLNTGMSYEDVKKIVSDGVLTTVELTSDDKEKKFYSYYNEDYSSAILTFIDDKLYSKSHNNLE